MGVEQAARSASATGCPGELLVRITPTTIVAQTDIAD